MLSWVALALSLPALVFSVAALGFHWIRRSEHPDVTKLRTDMLDLIDKTEHWIRRDRVRRLRASQEEEELPQAAPPAQASARDVKAELRRKVFGGNR